VDDGVDAWLDKEKLLPGQDWELEIKKAVREADVVVVCLSRQFNQAGFRQKEVRLALDTAMEKPEGEIFIIPARLEECDNLESLRRWHWVDLFEEDGHEMLMRALRRRADNIGATLQIKKGWLPKISSPLPKKQKTTESKANDVSEKNVLKTVEKRSQSPELPDDWETQWQAALVKNDKEEKASVEATDTKVDRQSAKKTRKPNTTIIIGFIVLAIASIFGLPSLFDTPMDEPIATQTKEEVALETQTPKPSSTSAISAITKTPSVTETPTPLPSEITDAKGVSMMLVSIDNASSFFVPPFYMDKYEVTNDLYKECVDAGFCSPPTNSIYFNQVSYSQHPVVYVTLDMANSFCSWRNSQLPTFDEFVAAIKGRDSSLYYPWTTTKSTDCRYANFASGYYKYCIGTTAPVGSYELGKSASNIYDLIGNVAEWSNNYYILGGSWASWMPSLFRQTLNTDDPISTNTIGFRCANAPTP
jgi:hypothetical protein